MESNTTLELIYRLVHFTNKNIFITGKAGTGKTTLLKQITQQTHKRFAIVAPTGVAAIQAGGVTIHSFFGIHPHTFIPFGNIPNNASIPIESAYSLSRTLRISQEKINILRSIDLLIIDEISMVRCDLLDSIDTVLRKYKKPELPFGGVQLLLFGDLFQLPPVVKEEEAQILTNYYPGFYFYESKALQKAEYKRIELTHIYRQTDQQFIEILNEIRFGTLSENTNRLLQKKISKHKSDLPEGTITLTTHVKKADEINTHQLNQLKEKQIVFEASISGEFQPSSYPTEASLKLKKGAQVMFIKNDKERRFYNGKIGIVEHWELDEDLEVIYVRCPDQANLICVSRETWRNVKYSFDQTKNAIQEDEKGEFSQFPLRLAWAITIHKSQGLTFEKVIIDIENLFIPGQFYVAMSRCKSLDGISFLHSISNRELKPNSDIIHFTNNFQPLEKIVDQLADEELVYAYSKSLNAFDFTWLKPQIREAQDALIPFLKYLNTESKEKIKSLEEFNQSITAHSRNYKPKIEQLFYSLSKGNFITEELIRFPKGVDYFCHELIHNISEPFHQILQELKEVHKIKSLSSCIHKIDSRIKEAIRQLIESKLLLHTWINRGEVLSIKQALNQSIEDEYSLLNKLNQEVLSAQIKTTKTKNKKKEKTPKGSTQNLSFKLFKQGMSIQEIALNRELKSTTIYSHLTKYIQSGELNINEIISENTITSIQLAIKKFPKDTKLGPILSSLNKQFETDEIKLVYADLFK